MSDMEVLFSTDPLELTQENLDDIVRYFRETNVKFNLGNMKAGSTKPKTAKQKEIEELAKSIDLNLDL